MKTYAFLITILFVFIISSQAAMGGKTGMDGMMTPESMSTQHATQQMSQHMMNDESMRKMMTFMNQMQTSMQDMSKLMGKHQMMNQLQLSESGKIMDQMSKQMHEMSAQMQAGKFDEKDLSLMRERHEEMIRNMDQLEKNLQKK